ncbi:MbcA/ParS/Xre antitoxin family protein [Achromobacter sp. ESBL13]|uniref:MbcA/ParS/Xre antitoxin family protein n=1 Tax=Achromobacter sp. ESBL13 TaxID=3077328 RepID=UPI002FC58B3E
MDVAQARTVIHQPPRAANAAADHGVTLALDLRLTQALGATRAPSTLQGAAPLLQALRQTFPEDVARWFPLLPLWPPEPGMAFGLDVSDLRALYHALRVVWLAELVFGGRDEAQRWLRSPKRRLLGRVPLLLCQHGRYAGFIESWLIDIDEGNGP